MPKIKITEQDLTRSSTVSVLDTVVYVPGPCTSLSGAIEPTLCKTVEDLDALGATGTGNAAIDMNALSYRLAKYLIGTFNFYVLYEGIGSGEARVPAKSWTKLQDINNYEITFLTTGQYGYIDSNAAGCAGKRGDCTYLANTTSNTGSSEVPVYTRQDTQDAPTGWPESGGTFPASPEFCKLAGEFVPVTGASAPAFELNKYYLKQTTGSGTEEKVDYILLTEQPAGWDNMITTSESTTLIYVRSTSVYLSLKGKPAETYVAGTYYIKTSTTGTWVENIRQLFEAGLTSNQSYCAGFTPWFITKNANLVGTGSTEELIPAAFGALFAYGRMAQEKYPWFAAAGANYGFINEASAFIHKCSNAECEVLQARAASGEVGLDESGDNIGMAINPMTEVKPFGNILWGYRTARNNGAADGLKATSFLNVRILVNILKKHLRQVARKYTFAQNDDVLWTNFSSDIIPVLEQMKSGRGIADYILEEVPTTAKARLKAKITIVPIEPVEDFELEIDLTDSLQVSE